MGFLAETAITLGRIAVAFYGFWFVWRVLLPVLPGPTDARDRVAPFVCYFTDPLVDPVARVTRIGTWWASVLYLVVIAGTEVGLSRVAALV